MTEHQTTVDSPNYTVEVVKSVDVEGAEPEQIIRYKQWASLCEQLFELLVERDMGYGGSFFRSAERRDGGPFENTTVDAIYGRFKRAEHKTDRFYKQCFDGALDDDADETAMDAAGIWVLATWLIRDYEPDENGLEKIATYHENKDRVVEATDD